MRIGNIESTRRGHIPALDGVRALAILFVLSAHFLVWTSPPMWVDKLPAKLAASGWVGVDLFFVLSGFLITGILLDARGRPDYFRRFYARRTLRIFPLYFGYLALIFFALPRVAPALVSGNGDLWWWTYTSNVYLALKQEWTGPSQAMHFWSLAVEEQFYLVWPVVVLALSRRRLLAVCVGCMVAAPLLRAGLFLAGSDGIAGYVLMPTRMDALAAGGLVAIYLRDPALNERWERWRGRAGWVAAVGLLLMFVSLRGLPSAHPLVEVVGYSLLAVLFASLVGRAAIEPEGTRFQRALSPSWLRAIGRYSYGMYVFHPLVASVLIATGITDHLVPAVGGSLLPAKLVYALLATWVTIGIAALSWHGVESKILAWRPGERRALGAALVARESWGRSGT